mgnify:CR=1 FL=1
MILKKVDMSVFVSTLVYEVRTTVQSVAGETARSFAAARAGAVQVQVLVQVPEPLLVPVPVRLVVPLLLPVMVLLVELVPVSEQVPVSMPDPLVDQPDPLTRSVPNPQLDQTGLLPLLVLEQLPVLDPLLKVVPMCETAAIVSSLL